MKLSTQDQQQIANNVLDRATRLTVKIGTNSIIDVENWVLKDAWVRGLCTSLIDLKRQFTIVSSGAIGLERLSRHGELPSSIEAKQAFAALGQPKLQNLYETVFTRLDQRVAQVLLTRENLDNDIGFATSRATLNAIRADGAYAIVNENDSVANEEIKFGDNDRLGAYTAHADQATTLILVTDVNGLYTANPKTNPDAYHIPVVETLTPSLMALGTGAVGNHSKGGMESKLIAAFIAAKFGIDTIIVNGHDHNCLTRLFIDRDTSQATIIPASAYPQISLF